MCCMVQAIWYSYQFVTPTLFNTSSNDIKVFEISMGSPSFTSSFIEDIHYEKIMSITTRLSSYNLVLLNIF